MMRKRLSFLVALSGTLFACSNGAPVDIGDPIGSNLSDFAGNWDGYAEAYTFGYPGSDRVRLVIDANGEGTMEFGDAPLVPPPTDPNLAYPVLQSDVNNFEVDALKHGFLYPLHDVTAESRRLRLTVHLIDVYAAWCELQTPVQTLNGDYACFDTRGAAVIHGEPRAASDNCTLAFGDGSTEPVDCGKYQLCTNYHVCDCTASGCAPSQDRLPVQLDAALEDGGSSLVGTLVLDTRITVRLHR